MDLTPSLDPEFLSDLDGVPVEEVTPHVEAVAREGSPAALKALTCVFVDRAIHVLRDGSRRDVLEEALAVSLGISGKVGDLLRERDRETYGAWAALDNLLGEAGRRSDRDAVPSILRNTQGLGLRVLEILAQREDGKAPRSRIREELALTESHLSHLLYNLEEAELVVRVRQGREVVVKLGPVGQEIVTTTVLPTWLQRFKAAIQRIEAGEEISAQELAKDLMAAEAPPSRAAADLISTALERLSKRQGALSRSVLRERAKQCSEKYKREDPHYLDVISSLPPASRPSQAFAYGDVN